MAISFDLSANRKVMAANAHYYKTPTEERYIDRIMQYHDLIYLIDGSWSLTENEKEYKLEKDDVLLLAAGRHHFTRSPCLAGTRTFCIHVTCEHGDNAESEVLLKLPTLLHMRAAPKVKAYFQDIVSTYWIDNPHKEECLSALVNLLLVELAREEAKKNCQDPDIAAKAIEIITATPHRRYQANEIADMLYVSTRTLNNAMHKKVGMPFYAFQMNHILDMVSSQLEMEPDLRLQEISTAFGFNDEFHLCKAFKKKYGISPQKYRKMNAIKEDSLDLT